MCDKDVKGCTEEGTAFLPEPVCKKQNVLKSYAADGRYYDESGQLSDYVDPNYRGRRSLNHDVNSLASKKTAAKGLLDLALLMANASQLKYILMTEGDHRFYAIMLSLIILSIILQLAVGIALLFLSRMKWDARAYNDNHTSPETGLTVTPEEQSNARSKNHRLDILSTLVVVAVVILTVVNVFISAFGLSEQKHHVILRDDKSATKEA